MTREEGANKRGPWERRSDASRERLSKAFVGIVGTAEPRRLQFTKQKATKKLENAQKFSFLLCFHPRKPFESFRKDSARLKWSEIFSTCLTGLLGHEKSYIFVTFWPRRTRLWWLISQQILRLTFQLSIVFLSMNCKDKDWSGRICCVLNC